MVLCALQEGSSYCMQERKDQKSLSRHPEAEEISKDLSQTILSHYDPDLLPFCPAGVFTADALLCDRSTEARREKGEGKEVSTLKAHTAEA